CIADPHFMTPAVHDSLFELFIFIVKMLFFYTFLFFFFTDTATTEIYTLSLHDALPISASKGLLTLGAFYVVLHALPDRRAAGRLDRKSTRLNSSHVKISYAVFCLKKKKK